MAKQTELRTIVSEDQAEQLETYFYEEELENWGIMQKERGDPFELFGFFPDPASAEAAFQSLRNDFPQLPETIDAKAVQDADWQNAYKEFVKPWSDRNLHWIPLWERNDAKIDPGNAAVVYLDAGMAFGTGAHETTRLCARRLNDYRETLIAGSEPLAAKQIVDAGCGSGVLAFSAVALGFESVEAFDFDPEAIIVCETNTVENAHLPKQPKFAVADLEKGLSAYAQSAKADLILANIQTDVLIPHSDPLVIAVADTGTLALSGILSKELDQVRNHFLERFAKLRPGLIVVVDSRVDGEWGDLLFSLASEADR